MSLVLNVLGYAAASALLLLVALYFYFTRHFGYWKKRGVTEIAPLPFVGNIKDVALFRQTINQFVLQLYNETRKLPYVGVYIFDQPLLVVNDLDLAKAVLVKDFSYFHDRSFHASEERDPLFGKSLVSLKGERWKKQRTAFGPSFTSGKMKKTFPFVVKKARMLVETICKESQGQPIEITALVARYTMEVIASYAFGMEANTLAEPDNAFQRNLLRFFTFTKWEGLKWVSTFLAPDIMFKLKLKLLKSDVDAFIIRMIADTVRFRQKERTRRNDFLDSVIQLQKTGRIEDDDDKVDEEKLMDKLTTEQEAEVAAQAFMILVAGFETSATNMSVVLFELAKHGDIQQRLREEIAAATEQDGSLTYETIMSLKYLDMVIQEALRKFPAVAYVDRVSNRPYTLPGTKLTLEKGTRLYVPLWGFHMDPDIYPNPTQFDPERFTDEAKASRHSMAHMPFGEGPRICTGMRFANMQTKTGLAHILLNYSIEPSSETPKEISMHANSFLLRPKHFKLQFRKL